VPSAKQTYAEVLSDAIEDFAEHGYDSAERVLYWSRKIKDAAEATMSSPSQMEEMLREALAATYRRMVEKGEIAKWHQGVGRFTIERLRPQLRAELDRRILASADLIRLNKQEAVAKTLHRFSGWATSIPKGGSDAIKKGAEKADLKKAMRSLPFVERRVLIDQGHKLVASINEIVARDGAALAGTWRSNFRQYGYDYRETHKERDGHTYLLRDTWALKAGFIKPGPDGYYDEITSAAQEPYCRCRIVWLYNLRDLPPNMLTKKGADELARVRATMAA
jgi:hypothetical protein